MRRARFVISSLVVVLLGVVALSHGWLAGAQSATPAAGGMTANPIVGSWIINDPTGTPAITAFTADGIVIDTETSGGTGIGSWQAAADGTVHFAMVVPLTGPQGQGVIEIRSTVTVDPSGKSFSAPYSYTVVAANGMVLASGKGNVTGARVPVESIDEVGTPMAGIPTWTPQTQSGAPATPAS